MLDISGVAVSERHAEANLGVKKAKSMRISDIQGAQKNLFKETSKLSLDAKDGYLSLERAEYDVIVHPNVEFRFYATLNKKNACLLEVPESISGLTQGMFLIRVGDRNVEDQGFETALSIFNAANRPVECHFASNPSFNLFNSHEVGGAIQWKHLQKERKENRSMREYTRHFLDSLKFQIFISLCIFFDFSLIFFDERWAKETSFALIFFYCVELIIRMWAYTLPIFVSSYLDIFDALIIMGSLIVTLAAHDSSVGSALILGRMAKVARVIRGIVKGYKEYSSLPSAMRKAARKNRQGIYDDKYDLDLCYISSRVIAMTLPSEKPRTLYNPLDDVREYLEEYHQNHYKIFNLSTDPEGNYNDEEFRNRVVRLPIEPGHVPTLREIYRFCVLVQEWMEQHPMNMIAVHCDRGSSRTGMMISGWLLFRYREILPQTALQYYNYMRTDWRKTKKIKNVKGVTSPSQQRMVEDFYFFMNMFCHEISMTNINHKAFVINRVVIGPVSIVGATKQKNQTWSYIIHQRAEDEEQDLDAASPVNVQNKYTLIGSATINPRGVEYAVIKDPLLNIVKGSIEVTIALNKKPWGSAWLNTDLWHVEPDVGYYITLRFQNSTKELIAMNQFHLGHTLCEVLQCKQVWHVEKGTNHVIFGVEPKNKDDLARFDDVQSFVDPFNASMSWEMDMYHLALKPNCKLVGIQSRRSSNPGCLVLRLGDVDHPNGDHCLEPTAKGAGEEFQVILQVTPIEDPKQVHLSNLVLPHWDSSIGEKIDLEHDDDGEAGMRDSTFSDVGNNAAFTKK